MSISPMYFVVINVRQALALTCQARVIDRACVERYWLSKMSIRKK